MKHDDRITNGGVLDSLTEITVCLKDQGPVQEIYQLGRREKWNYIVLSILEVTGSPITRVFQL